MSKYVFGKHSKLDLSSSPTQAEVESIITDQLVDGLHTIIEGEATYSAQDVLNNEQSIVRFEKQHSGQLKSSKADHLWICLSIMQVFLGYQARRIGLEQPLHEQWLFIAFTHLTSIGRASNWNTIAFKSVLLIFEYFGSHEEKVMHLLKSIQSIRNRKILLQILCSSILKANFHIRKSKAFGEFLATQKCWRHCESSHLKQFYGKGLTQSQEDAVLKLSLLTYALNAALSFARSGKYIEVVRKTLFEHQAKQTTKMFKLLTSIGRSVFGERISCSMTRPFRKLLEGFNEISSKYKLFACPQAILCQIMMVNMMIMGGIQIPKTAAERDPIIWQEKVERIKQEDLGLLLPFISQQYARSMMFSSRRGQVKPTDYLLHFQQNLFEAEDILIEYLPLHFQQRQEQPIRNLLFLFHKLHLLIGCYLKLHDTLRMCIYYLALCHKLNRSHKKGMTVLRKALSSIPNETHLLPQKKTLTKAIAAAIGLQPSRSQVAIVSNLLASIAEVDPSIADYLRHEYLEDRKPHEMQISRKFGLICSFHYYLFGKSRPPNAIREALQKQSFLYDLIQKHKKFTGLITPHQNSLMEERGPSYERQFLDYRQRIDQFLRESQLRMESMQMVRRHLSEAFTQAKESDDPQQAMRRLGKKSIRLLGCGFLIHYCLIALREYLTPLNRQRILGIHYRQHSWSIIQQVIHIIGADRATSILLLTS